MKTSDQIPSAPLAEIRGISKRFGGVVALDQVNLTIRPGEVIGLVGDNGAGKSTLIKILSGAYLPDQGEILFEGQSVQIRNPRSSKDLGIETVYQDLALVDTLDVPGNIFLGREIVKFGFGPLRVLDKSQMAREAENILQRLGISLESLQAEVGLLSGGQRQSVAISRAILTEPKLIILDEPTAALAVMEVGHVLELVHNLREHNIGLVFISHVLQEVFEVADRIVVLRKGRKVADLVKEEASIDLVVNYMVGKIEEKKTHA
ncbi:MAG: ATP-binding cassette domain-containing protein [Desulfobacterales bacterium]|nr:ATP-binding cassette domain-containing protein [Desulfobacterales bacterium]